MTNPTSAAAAAALWLLLAACGGASGTTTAEPAPPPATAAATAPAASSPSVAVTSTTTQPPLPAAACPTPADAPAATVESDVLGEISGVAAGRAGVLWVHNDSGGGPYIYTLGARGALLATYELAGAGAEDWEDVAVGPGPEPGLSYLYVGDIGDNLAVRSEVTVYRVPEPAVDAAHTGVVRLEGVDAITLRYPDEPQNAEALLVDPRSGDLILITKDALGHSEVYGSPAPLPTGEPVTLDHLGSLRLGLGSLVTAGDISRTGELIALRTYTEVFVWSRPSGTTVATALGGVPCRVPVLEPQGEAIAFLADGGLVTISEGARPPILVHGYP